MRIFFDTEFTGLHKNTTLISIGLLSEDGKSFYAEFIDYDESQCNEWIQKNVIANLSKDTNELSTFADINILGNSDEIRDELLKWLVQFDCIEWVSDVCYYDFILLIDLLFKNAMEIPTYDVSPVCHDINQDIAKYFAISESSAFSSSREEVLKKFHKRINGKKHNSLYDAKVIKTIYESITEAE